MADPNGDEEKPGPGDFIDKIRYSVASRTAGEEIGKHASPAPLIGKMASLYGQLLSSLVIGGSSPTTAAEKMPVYIGRLVHVQSVDMELVLEPHGEPLDGRPPTEDLFERLDVLTSADPDDIRALVADFGGAATQAYRKFATLLGDYSLEASFWIPDQSRAAELDWPRASAHARLLNSEEVIETSTFTLSGILDMLEDSRSRFSLRRDDDYLDAGSKEEWKRAVGNRPKIEGALSEDAMDDIQIKNAWRKQIMARVEVTKVTSPKTTKSMEIEAVLREVESVQDRIH
jgi:hypothetical protein